MIDPPETDLFDPAVRTDLLRRLESVAPSSPRQWGKMDAAQAMTHLAITMEAANGTAPMRQKWLGKILAPLVRGSVLGPKPFSRNSPTDPKFIVADPRDFAREKDRLLGAIRKFVEIGPAGAARSEHAFFGRLSGEEWGRLMAKHLDHHLRQFGA